MNNNNYRGSSKLAILGQFDPSGGIEASCAAPASESKVLLEQMSTQKDEALGVPTEEQGGKGCAAIGIGISLLLLPPSLGIAVIAPMAGASGTTAAVAVAYLLLFAPLILIAAAAAGLACYRRYTRLRLTLAIMLLTPLVLLYASMLGHHPSG